MTATITTIAFGPLSQIFRAAPLLPAATAAETVIITAIQTEYTTTATTITAAADADAEDNHTPKPPHRKMRRL